ncbi:hypothetical protein CDAR_7081 [Caerostris darwini]|uniref:Uncharacterized protein n=1 Tax=Caerostris darwini TaxID=1538125 RepID=A0AAV4PI76_9ARAC|nr:hypothetical protein CDAR_7081 [Caerostris darwini]
MNPKKNQQRRNLATRTRANHSSGKSRRKLQRRGNSLKKLNEATNKMKNRSISLGLRAHDGIWGGCSPCTDRSTLRLESPARSPRDTHARARR